MNIWQMEHEHIHPFYWRTIPSTDEPKTSWTCWHMFRPYNLNIFKTSDKARYCFREQWRG